MKQFQPSALETAVLQETTAIILSSKDIDSALHQILLIVRNYFDTANCALYLVDPAGRELYCRAQNGFEDYGQHLPRLPVSDDSVIGWAAAHKAQLHVPQVGKESRYVIPSHKKLSELALPLMVGEEVIGVLDIGSPNPGYFTGDTIDLLMLFAGQATVALEHARLNSIEQRRRRQIEVVSLIARSSTSVTDLDQFLAITADLLYDTFDGTDVSILLRDSRLKLRAHAHAGGGRHTEQLLMESEGSGIIAEALRSKATAVSGDSKSRAGWARSLPEAGSELAVPLISMGEVLGFILVVSKVPVFFSSEDCAIAQVCGDLVAGAIKNSYFADEMLMSANRDPLTGAYNQRFLHAMLTQETARAKRYDRKFCALMLDLKNFREVNEGAGFDGGDQVLRSVSRLLGSQIRAMDTLCRYSEDRFVLLLPETDGKHVAPVIGKLQDLLASERFKSTQGMKPLAATYAIAEFPVDGSSEVDLLHTLRSRIAESKK